MAEILLSLTIIGVVAAITLPSLTGNINERTWNTQRKALYARISQAIALLPSLNGYGVLEDGDPNNVAEVFLTEGLSKVLKINNICDSEHLSDCGIPSKITAMDTSVINSIPKTVVGLNSMFDGTWYDSSSLHSFTYYQTDTKAAAFETANGESILTFYNPNCQSDLHETGLSADVRMQPKMCANFVYDLNGSKGPNTVGKDIGFISAIYAVDSIVVAPMPMATSQNQSTPSQIIAPRICKESGGGDLRLANRFELASMFYNNLFIGMTVSEQWSSTVSVDNPGMAWTMRFHTGGQGLRDRNGSGWMRCIRR